MVVITRGPQAVGDGTGDPGANEWDCNPSASAVALQLEAELQVEMCHPPQWELFNLGSHQWMNGSKESGKYA